MPAAVPDAQKHLLATLLDGDPELQRLARDLLVRGLRESIDQLVRGDSSTRASIAKSLISVYTRALTDVEAGEDENAGLRAEMHEMIAGVRGEIMGGEEGEGEEGGGDLPAPKMVAKS